MKSKLIGVVGFVAIAIAGTVSAQQGDNYSSPIAGANELVTPSGTGNETGGYFFTRNAPQGQSVLAEIYSPSSPNEACPSCREYYASQPSAPAAAAPAPASLAQRP